MNDQSTAIEMPPAWLSWAIGIACLVAILDMPYGYYQFLRLVVTAYAAYVSYVYFRADRVEIAWAFVFIALIYNPVFPIAMTKGVHAIFNVLAAASIFAEFYLVRSRGKQSHPDPVITVAPPLIGPTDRSDFAKFIAREIVIVVIAIGAAIGAFYFGMEAYQKNPQADYTEAPPAE